MERRRGKGRRALFYYQHWFREMFLKPRGSLFCFLVGFLLQKDHRRFLLSFPMLTFHVSFRFPAVPPSAPCSHFSPAPVYLSVCLSSSRLVSSRLSLGLSEVPSCQRAYFYQRFPFLHSDSGDFFLFCFSFQRFFHPSCFFVPHSSFLFMCVILLAVEGFPV